MQNKLANAVATSLFLGALAVASATPALGQTGPSNGQKN